MSVDIGFPFHIASYGVRGVIMGAAQKTLPVKAAPLLC
jgi:hypothetical protein